MSAGQGPGSTCVTLRTLVVSCLNCYKAQDRGHNKLVLGKVSRCGLCVSWPCFSLRPALSMCKEADLPPACRHSWRGTGAVLAVVSAQPWPEK